MQEIIKKAIEGGWKPGYKNSSKEEHLYFVIHDYEAPTEQEIVCDPIFWQSLGKACGWEEAHKENNFSKAEWVYQGRMFHEINLTEGWNRAVEYLNELIK